MMDADGMSRALLCPSPGLQDGPQQLKVHAKLGSFFIPSPGDGAGGSSMSPVGHPRDQAHQGTYWVYWRLGGRKP